MVPLERSWRGFQTFLSRCIVIKSMVLVLTKISNDMKGLKIRKLDMFCPGYNFKLQFNVSQNF